jgi:hypothetical protein
VLCSVSRGTKPSCWISSYWISDPTVGPNYPLAVSMPGMEFLLCSYGEQAGVAARQGMSIAVDAYDVYGAYKAMRTRALAKAFLAGTVKSQGAADGSGAVAEAGAPAQGRQGELGVEGSTAAHGGIQTKETVVHAAADEDTGRVQLVEPLLH